MENDQDILTPEQDRELDALVRIAHVIAYRKNMPFEEFNGKLRFMLSCLGAYWGLEIKDLPAIMARVLEIAAQQKAEMIEEQRRLQA